MNWVNYDSCNPIPYCVSSGGSCKLSGHCLTINPPYSIGYIIGMITYPVIIALMIGYWLNKDKGR
jgi:hypothetical protein